MKKKRSLKQNIALIIRGYQTIYQISKKWFWLTMLTPIIEAILAYFILYMSSLVVNELTTQCNRQLLFCYTGITVFGVLFLNWVGRLLTAKNSVESITAWHQEDQYFMNVQNSLKYEYLENAKIRKMQEEIETAKTATGGGILFLKWMVTDISYAIIHVICAVGLTFSMFRVTNVSYSSKFLNFINSVGSTFIILTIIVINTVIASYCEKICNKKVIKEWEGLSKTNMLSRELKKCQGNDVKVFGMKKVILQEYQKKLIRPAFIKRSQKHKMRYRSIKIVWNAIMTCLILIYVMGKSYIGIYGIGNFILYRGAIEKFVQAVSKFGEIIGGLMQNNNYLERTFEYIDLPKDSNEEALNLHKEQKNQDKEALIIEFCHVSFRYPNAKEYSLKDINLRLDDKSKYALVGPNGSGKSTLVKLLTRLYEPTEGVIRLNGIDIREYDMDAYLKKIGVVFQDYKIFSFSIGMNVSAALTYNQDNVNKCLGKVGLMDRVKQMELGTDTYIHRDYENVGIDLSGGEEQRLAIARSIYRDAKLMILDEPTSALDPFAEEQIYKNFYHMISEKMAILISHRMSACCFCDQIIVLNEGRIEQVGTHNELLTYEDQLYYKLWNVQAQYYVNS